MLYSFGGLKTYEFQHANFGPALPPVRTVKNYKKSGTYGTIFEGEQLLDHLNMWQASKFVFFSEDATGINRDIKYNAQTNTISGVCILLDPKTGFPCKMVLLANDYDSIKQIASMEKSNIEEYQTFVIVFLAMIILVILLFRFTALHVLARW